MEQYAKQRESFINASKNYNDQESSISEPSKLQKPGTSKDGAGGPHKIRPNKRAAAEDQDQSQDRTLKYFCCFCRFQTEATENRPIGLITLIQSTSILAHKNESNNHLGIC